jgi:hypothetical protein
MKRFLTAFAIVLAILLSVFVYVIYKPDNLPISDLISPSQEVRAAAAKYLRANARPPSKIKWVLRTAFIRTGQNKTDIDAYFSRYHISPEPDGGFHSLGPDIIDYPLDYYWTFKCAYDENDHSLVQFKFIPEWCAFGDRPSTNFSGIWITYYANGQKFSEGNFINGLPVGEHTTFASDGSKSSVWHYENWIANGLHTQYFLSGQIQYQVQYSNNVKVGNGIWYNKDGSTNHISNYSKP